MTQHKIPNPNIQIPKRLKLQGATGWAASIANLTAGKLGTYQVDVKINGQVVGSGMFQLK
jgi:hypothetical protein